MRPKHSSKTSTSSHQLSILARTLILFTVYTFLCDSFNLRQLSADRELELEEDGNQAELAQPSTFSESSGAVDSPFSTSPRGDDDKHGCCEINLAPPSWLINGIAKRQLHHKCNNNGKEFSQAHRQLINGNREIWCSSCLGSSCGFDLMRKQKTNKQPRRRWSRDSKGLFGMSFSNRRWLPGIQLASAIRLVRLDVPQSVQAGQTVRLRCIYDAKNDKLQSLSWYKNGREFYRYQPFERRQPVLVFNATGVQLDISRSRNNTITLVNTTAETSGKYKCEATGTSFQEANLDTYLDVIPANSSSGVISGAIEINLALLIWGTILIFNYLFTFE